MSKRCLDLPSAAVVELGVEKAFSLRSMPELIKIIKSGGMSIWERNL